MGKIVEGKKGKKNRIGKRTKDRREEERNGRREEGTNGKKEIGTEGEAPTAKLPINYIFLLKTL